MMEIIFTILPYQEGKFVHKYGFAKLVQPDGHRRPRKISV